MAPCDGRTEPAELPCDGCGDPTEPWQLFRAFAQRLCFGCVIEKLLLRMASRDYAA